MKALTYLLCLLPAFASALTLDEAIDLAIRNDPELQALRREERATQNESAFAARLLQRNPTLVLEGGAAHTVDPAAFEYLVALEQPLELGGQVGARRRAAEAASSALDARRRDRQSALRADVRIAFVQALAASQRQRLAEQSAALAKEAADAAQARYDEGRIPLLERNGTRVEQARAARQLAEARVQSARARAQLRQLLGLGRDEPLELQDDLSWEPSGASREQLDSLVRPEESTPEPPAILAARWARDEARARRDESDAFAFPELVLGGFFEHEAEGNTWGATLGLELPLFFRNEPDRAAAERNLAESEARLEAQRRQTAAAEEEARARLGAAGAAIMAYEAEALDALAENLRLATEAYRDGDVDFLTFLVVRREALEGRLAWIDALEELALAQAAYDRALGR